MNRIEQLMELDLGLLCQALAMAKPRELADIFIEATQHPLWHMPSRTTVKIAGGWYTPMENGRYSYAHRREEFEDKTRSRIETLKGNKARNEAKAKEAEEAAYWEARGVTTGVRWLPTEYA